MINGVIAQERVAVAIMQESKLSKIITSNTLKLRDLGTKNKMPKPKEAIKASVYELYLKLLC